jgi:thiol-disulfide isomerase/thioredoxin
LLRVALIYLALAVGANAAPLDIPALEALREGTLRKLTFVDPEPVPDTVFTDAEGAEHTLADWRGKWVVLNFWATWCVPCRAEMPSLDTLSREMGGARLAVVPVATGRNDLQAIRRFFEETGVTALPVLLDPRQQLAREMGVLGLPVTVLIDPDGNVVARLIGDAEWSGDSARAILEALLAP